MSREREEIVNEYSQLRVKVERLSIKLRRYCLEQDVSSIQSGLVEIKQLFETTEDLYYMLVDTSETVADTESFDKKYSESTKLYCDVVKACKKTLKECGVQTTMGEGIVNAENVDISSSQTSIASELANAITLPKINVPIFSGEPSEYATFVNLFDEAIANKISCNRSKLTHLSALLRGEALQAVKPFLTENETDSYVKAREVLQVRFGNKFLLSQSILNSLSNGKKVSGPQGMRQLSDEIAEARAVLNKTGDAVEMNSQSVIKGVLARCPLFIQRKWSKLALDIRERDGNYPGFLELENFMKKEAMRASDPMYGMLTETKAQIKTNVLSAEPESTRGKFSRDRYCVVCGAKHELWNCQEFKSLNVDDKFAAARTCGACYICLQRGHMASMCQTESRCATNGCGGKHHTLLHRAARPKFNALETSLQSSGEQEILNRVQSSAVNSRQESRVILPIIPVIVNGKKVNALLDTGSTQSLITTCLAETLGVHSVAITCEIDTVNGTTKSSCRSVDVKLSPLSSNIVFLMKGLLTVDRIPAEATTLSADLSKYPHLASLPIMNSPSKGTVDILIGMDHPELLRPLEVRHDDNNPNTIFASKTVLGWTIQGPVSSSGVRKHSVNFINIQQIHDDLHQLWSIEKDGDDELGASLNDAKVIDMWEERTVFKDGHYEVPIPWREGQPCFPDNHYLAGKRLEGTLRKICKNGDLEKYSKSINEMIEQGFAEEVNIPVIKQPGKVWYLPHHAVIHPQKKKLRIVFDCSCTQNGKSLNKSALSGPDLVTKLLHVLLRFRQYEVAVTADVKAMYMQVRLPENDRDCLRFLWKLPSSHFVKTYRMCSHVFGGIWCASSSTFALRRTVQDFHGSTRAYRTIHESMYVDDYLDSQPRVVESQASALDTYSVLKLGGFRLTKFSSNVHEAISVIPTEDRLSGYKVIADLNESKVLGMRWDVQNDGFRYDVIINNMEVVTRREMLSNVASIYDPLGLVAPIVLEGKLLFQEATRLGLSWDDHIPASLATRWRLWMISMRGLSGLFFPRCLVPTRLLDGQMELHHFCDGSLQAYGTASFLRIQSGDDVRIVLVTAKSRVAPIKAMTIPRLEMAAAVLAVKQDILLRRELRLKLSSSCFWSDSQVVLSYIASDSRRFKVFIANRVSFIRKHTKVRQWRYVNTKENPADIASRGCRSDSMPLMWVQGPDFLRDPEKGWLMHATSHRVKSDDDEIKAKQVMATSIGGAEGETPVMKLVKYFGNLYRLCKAVVVWLKFGAWLRARKKAIDSSITSQNISSAEMSLVVWSQHQAYSHEIRLLASGRSLSATCPLSCLDPFLDQGVLRVGGRLRNSHLDMQVKHPAILPPEQSITKLILRQCHENGHVGVEWALSRLRERFWIVKARVALKKICRECVQCKKLFGTPMVQKMADLPANRCTPSDRAFSSVGVDLFGPFLVKQGRSVIKRYGCIFTCMRSRAVHLEILNSMEADSFINALVRFSARRGRPVEVLSDNGKNFVGAVSELRQEFKKLDKAQLVREARRRDVQWSFNPPYASHFGGVWERLIRTVRRLLCTILNSNVVSSDEILMTVMCEVESMINSRPLTKVSDDPSDLHPITPNHFIMASGSEAWPWAGQDASICARRRWRRVQAYTAMIWKRWIKEYLPSLQQRQKWRVEKPVLAAGDLVMVSDLSCPRCVWPLGHILEVYPGNDGLVRSAKVRTKLTTLIRPVSKLIHLELDGIKNV